MGCRRQGLGTEEAKRKLAAGECGLEKCGGVSFAQAVPRADARRQKMATFSKRTKTWEERPDSAVVWER